MTFDFSAVAGDTQFNTVSDLGLKVTKPIETNPDSSIWDLIPKETLPTFPNDRFNIHINTTDSILDDKGINHLESPKDREPDAVIKDEDGNTQKVYTNPDGSSTVVTGNDSLIGIMTGAETTVTNYDKDGNKTKETTASGVAPRTESTTTYNEDGSVASEVVTKTNFLTGEVETVVREYLEDGSYVETTTSKDAEGKETAGASYIYDKDGNKIDVNDMTEEQYNKVLEAKEAFSKLGLVDYPSLDTHWPILYDDTECHIQEL